MCGIVGYNGSFKGAALQFGLISTGHCGPDDSGIYLNALTSVGLEYSRSWILDLSPLGHQPMHCADDEVVLVFNGEINNFRESKFELAVQDYVFQGHSVTGVLLNMYLTEGEAILRRLNGIVTFAMRDERSNSLFLVRVGFGVKPLYCAGTADGVGFASDIKALLQLVPDTHGSIRWRCTGI